MHLQVMLSITDAYLKPCQTSMMEIFAKINTTIRYYLFSQKRPSCRLDNVLNIPLHQIQASGQLKVRLTIFGTLYIEGLTL